MSQQNPIPRTKRGPIILTATEGQALFSFPFWLADAEDVEVRRQLTGEASFGEPLTLGVDYVVAGLDQSDGATIATSAGQAAGTKFRLRGKRLPSRTTSVVRGGTVRSGPLEKELDLVTTTLQELRRDVDAVDVEGALEARDEAVLARDEIRQRYLGEFDALPTQADFAFPLVNGAMIMLAGQLDPADDGLYVWQDDQWFPATQRPQLYGRSVVVFVTSGIVASGIVPVPGGYTPGHVDVLRKGVDMVIGASPGIANDLDPDCAASDGLNIVFPAGVLKLNEPIKIVRRRPVPMAGILASDVMKGGSDVATVLDSKAPLASPAFTGTPTAPNLTGGSGSGQVANKKYVDDILAAAISPGAVLVDSGVTAAQASLDIALAGGWRGYELVLDTYEHVAAGQSIYMRLAQDGVPNFINGANTYEQVGETLDRTGAAGGLNGFLTGAVISGNLPAAGSGHGAHIRILLSASRTGMRAFYRARATYVISGSGLMARAKTDGALVATGPITHVRLIPNSGNIAAGARWQLYGLRANP